MKIVKGEGQVEGGTCRGKGGGERGACRKEEGEEFERRRGKGTAGRTRGPLVVRDGLPPPSLRPLAQMSTVSSCPISPNSCHIIPRLEISQDGLVPASPSRIGPLTTSLSWSWSTMEVPMPTTPADTSNFPEEEERMLPLSFRSPEERLPFTTWFNQRGFHVRAGNFVGQEDCWRDCVWCRFWA